MSLTFDNEIHWSQKACNSYGIFLSHPICSCHIRCIMNFMFTSTPKRPNGSKIRAIVNSTLLFVLLGASSMVTLYCIASALASHRRPNVFSTPSLSRDCPPHGFAFQDLVIVPSCCCNATAFLSMFAPLTHHPYRNLA